MDKSLRTSALGVFLAAACVQAGQPINWAMLDNPPVAAINWAALDEQPAVAAQEPRQTIKKRVPVACYGNGRCLYQDVIVELEPVRDSRGMVVGWREP